MKRSHAARSRHLAAQRKAASSRMDRRIERDALGKEAARRARQAKARFQRWEAAPLRPPGFGGGSGLFGLEAVLGMVRGVDRLKGTGR